MRYVGAAFQLRKKARFEIAFDVSLQGTSLEGDLVPDFKNLQTEWFKPWYLYGIHRRCRDTTHLFLHFRTHQRHPITHNLSLSPNASPHTPSCRCSRFAPATMRSTTVYCSPTSGVVHPTTRPTSHITPLPQHRNSEGTTTVVLRLPSNSSTCDDNATARM